MKIKLSRILQKISQSLKRQLAHLLHLSQNFPIPLSPHPPILVRPLLLTLLFLLTLTVPSLSSPPPPVDPLPPSHPTPQLIDQGKAFYSQGQFDQAAMSWRQAAQTYADQGDDLHQAMALTYLSLAYQQLERWPDAETTIDASLSLLTSGQDDDDSPVRSQLYAQALNAQGRLKFGLGQLAAALQTWRQATDAYRQLADQTGVTGSLINQAQAMEALGFYRQSCRTLLTALAPGARCDSLEAETLTAVLQTIQSYPDPAIQVLGLRSLGVMLRLVDNLERSEQVLKVGLAIAQQLPSAQAESATWLALAETQRAHYQQIKDAANGSAARVEPLRTAADIGLDHYQKAAQLAARESVGKARPVADLIQIQAQLQRLSLLLDWQAWLHTHHQNSDPETRQIQVQVQALLNSPLADLPPSRVTVYARLNLARSLIQLRRIDRFDPIGEQTAEYTNTALQLATAAFEAATDLGDSRGQSYALGILGGLHEQLQNWPQAQSFSQSALNLAQTLQAEDMAYQWQWQLGRIYAAQAQTQSAIDAYSQALNTLQSLRRDLAFLNPDVQFSFRQNIEPVYRQLVNLLLMPNTPSPANLKQARLVMDSLQLAVVENYLQQACSDAPLAEIDRVVDQSDATAAFIYTVILADRLEVILKLPQSDDLQSYRVFLPKAEVEQTLMALRRSLQQKIPSKRPEMQRLSKQVYDWLVAPAEAALEQSAVKTIVFVLDGQLRNIPIAALYDGKQYLIEKYAIAITPGLQLLDPKPLERDSLQALVVGSTQPLLAAGIRGLPGVSVEIESIKNSLDKTDVLLDQDFTQQALRRQINRRPVPIVHIATHGQFSSRSEQTFILAGDGDRIHLNQLAELLRSRDQTRPDPVELLFLSACQTVAGDKRAALGMAGVAVRSGARSTIASLWYADDEATAQLVGHFYQRLSDPTVATKAEALRLAQQDLLMNPRMSLPVFWAPFVLLGNWL